VGYTSGFPEKRGTTPLTCRPGLKSKKKTTLSTTGHRKEADTHLEKLGKREARKDNPVEQRKEGHKKKTNQDHGVLERK